MARAVRPSVRHLRRACLLAIAALPALALPGLLARPAAAAGACPCTLFSSSAVPGTPDDSDLQAQAGGIEVGLKFYSDQAGWITGLRFYKGATNAGVHTGSLWRADGTRLRTVDFDGESADGWQAMSFRQPVGISANTPYVASYHADFGSYSSDSGSFDQQSSPTGLALAGGISYDARISPWFALSPEFFYTWHAIPNGPGIPQDVASVYGLRVNFLWYLH